MRKILVTTFATVLLLSSIASNANLMIDEKQKPMIIKLRCRKSMTL